MSISVNFTFRIGNFINIQMKKDLAESEWEVLDGVGIVVGLLRILGVGVRIFDRLSLIQLFFNMALPVYFFLLHKLRGSCAKQNLGGCVREGS